MDIDLGDEPMPPRPRDDDPKGEFEETKEEAITLDDEDDGFGDDGDGDWEEMSDDDDDWGELEESTENGPQLKGRHDPIASTNTYTILSPDDLEKQRRSFINEVIDALFPDNSPREASDMAISLLQQYRWNKAKVMDAFVNDPDRALKESGITALRVADSTPDGMIECPQCYDDVKTDDCFGLKCRHLSCRSCWVDYMSWMNKQGNEGVVIKCNYAKCNLVVPDSAWNKLLPAALKAKRRKFVLDQFVDCQADLVWCPGAGCDKVAKDPMRDSPEIECPCGTVFCFKCQGESHRPCRCDWARTWIIKCSSEAENAVWILANTKRCPKCQTQIEKNQGCNHMTCRSCKHEFCWLCKGDWKIHGTATGGYYRCNRYDENLSKGGGLSEEEIRAETAKNELQKYLHYYQRFDNHCKARKFAMRSLDKTMTRMKSLQDLKGGCFNDVSFLEGAVQTVIVCRQLLKWTYAMGYYMEPNTKEKNLFEHLQENLEKNTEHLHELSEKPLEDLVSVEARTKIINFTRVTNKFRKNLMQGIEEGLTGHE